MEPEFISSHQINPLSCLNIYRQLEIDVGDYDRPLSKDDLLCLLSVDGIEFELLLANEILRPSLSMEYHAGRFLGFFTYWDCLAARISRVTLPPTFIQRERYSEFEFCLFGRVGQRGLARSFAGCAASGPVAE